MIEGANILNQKPPSKVGDRPLSELENAIDRINGYTEIIHNEAHRQRTIADRMYGEQPTPEDDRAGLIAVDGCLSERLNTALSAMGAAINELVTESDRNMNIV